MRFGKSCWKRSRARTRNFFSPLSIQTSKSLSAVRKASRLSEKFWKPEDINSEVWNTLARLLRLGGTFEESKNEFWAPYVFSRFPDHDGGFDFSAIIARDVRVRSEPNDKAPMIASLSYDIVLNLSGSDSPERKNRADSAWVRIRLPDGREGFVSAQFIRSPTDYRAGFKKTGGKWLLTHLVAGD